MTSHETDRLAFQLIDVASDALNQLYNGSLPQPLKNHIKKSFDINKKGRPPETHVLEREREIAIRASLAKWMTELLEHSPNKDNVESELKSQGHSLEKNYSGYVEKLAAEFECDRADIFHIVKKFESDMGVNVSFFQIIEQFYKITEGSEVEKLKTKETLESHADIISHLAITTEAKIRTLVAIGRCQGFAWKGLAQQEREKIPLYQAFIKIISDK